ncbi:MAG TPA: sterol desaturase family protein [Solirubrobacteraceae bacterium]|nr:sterol desaturase family protein [Solirubrobacteraceae bacterium]
MSAERVPAEYDRKLTSKRADLTELGACWREYFSHFSPRAALASIAIVLAARVYVGQWSWHDILPPVVLVAAQPFVEWVIHKYLLHLPPFRFRGRTIELYGSIQHRNHHLTPSDLDRVLLKPIEIISFVVQIGVVMTLLTLAVALPPSWPVLPLALTGITFSYLGLFRYEWSHFLIHTPYVPKTRWYRTVWRNHRLHHFKHEGYWMGVSSNLGDRVLGTNPDQRSIEKSPTARTLGVEDEPAATAGR